MDAPQPASILRRVHRIFGIFTLLAFLASGAYMRTAKHGLLGLDPAVRMAFRARHINILAAALVHLALGAYVVTAPSRRRRGVQICASALLCLAALALIAGFCIDPYAPDFRTGFTTYGLFGLLAGTVLHCLATGKRGTAGP